MPGLDAWLAQDQRHAGALLRAQALLHLLGTGGVVEEQAAPTPASTPAPARRRWLWAGAMAAAGLAALLLVDWDAQTYATDPGETRRVALADGSALTIDSASRLKVDLDKGERTVTLREGRALFQVAHDAARPFRVAVGGVTITDIGTTFQVSRGEAGVDVLVSAGEVEVVSPAGRLRLVAGQRALFSARGVPVAGALAPAAMERALAWTSGRIELDGETLAEAVAAMNRHNRRAIRLADPALGAEKLYGAFRLDDPEGFARAAALSLGGRARAEVPAQDGAILITAK